MAPQMSLTTARPCGAGLALAIALVSGCGGGSGGTGDAAVDGDTTPGPGGLCELARFDMEQIADARADGSTLSTFGVDMEGTRTLVNVCLEPAEGVTFTCEVHELLWDGASWRDVAVVPTRPGVRGIAIDGDRFVASGLGVAGSWVAVYQWDGASWIEELVDDTQGGSHTIAIDGDLIVTTVAGGRANALLSWTRGPGGWVATDAAWELAPDEQTPTTDGTTGSPPIALAGRQLVLGAPGSQQSATSFDSPSCEVGLCEVDWVCQGLAATASWGGATYCTWDEDRLGLRSHPCPRYFEPSHRVGAGEPYDPNDCFVGDNFRLGAAVHADGTHATVSAAPVPGGTSYTWMFEFQDRAPWRWVGKLNTVNEAIPDGDEMLAHDFVASTPHDFELHRWNGTSWNLVRTLSLAATVARRDQRFPRLAAFDDGRALVVTRPDEDTIEDHLLILAEICDG